MKTLAELQRELFEANSAQDLVRGKRIVAEIRRHPDYRARSQRYVVATRRNSRPII